MNDVVIIGGGPAGSALGAYLSLAGIKNTIFESAIHPRPHVGESLVVSTMRIFREIGFLDTLEGAGFVRKCGAAWHPPRRQASVLTDFCWRDEDEVLRDYTYQVDRGRFDLLLLKHAESLGSKVYQGVRVQEVLMEDGAARGVRFEVAGQSVTCPADLVVDASGRNTLLGRQLGLKQADPLFNQFAVHAWFEGVDRGAVETADYIHIHFLPVKRGWVWQIPISEEVTSIGVVAEKAVFKESKKDHASWFRKLSGSAPDIAHAMRDATRVKDFTVEADYSYSMRRLVGDGFLLIGDAARFVDPIFSSGVSVALYSARFAAEGIRHACESGDFREEVFRPYEEKMRQGTMVWYKFIRLYYKLLPIMTHFFKSEKHRDQLIQLLRGEVYDNEEVPVLEAMREFIVDVEKAENHVFKPYIDDAIPLD